jgi:hypothetical protein
MKGIFASRCAIAVTIFIYMLLLLTLFAHANGQCLMLLTMARRCTRAKKNQVYKNGGEDESRTIDQPTNSSSNNR